MATAQQEMTGSGFTKNTLDFAKNVLNEIIGLREQKDAIQQSINAKFEDLKAQGVAKKAAKRALTLKTLDEDKLAKEDASEALCREALEIGVQMQLELIDGGKD